MKISFAAVLVLALSAGSMSNSPGPTPVHKTIFAPGATSTGWIDFDFYDEKHIFIPAKVNGHDAAVLLALVSRFLKLTRLSLRPLESSRRRIRQARHNRSTMLGLPFVVCKSRLAISAYRTFPLPL